MEGIKTKTHLTLLSLKGVLIFGGREVSQFWLLRAAGCTEVFASKSGTVQSTQGRDNLLADRFQELLRISSKRLQAAGDPENCDRYKV
jgi:hypothetical protein